VTSSLVACPRSGFTPSQALSTFYNAPTKRELLRTANRVGKTTHVGAKVAALMESTPGLRLRGVSVDYNQSKKAMGLILSQMITPSALASGCNYNVTRGWSHNLIELKNGSTLQIMNNTQDPQAFEGDSLDGVWFDEPPKQGIWLPNISRVMDRNGFVWISATMVGRPCSWLREIAEAEGSPWRQTVVGFSRESCPWYTPDMVAGWIAEAKAAPWEYPQRIDAEWEGVAVGRRYTGYTEASVVKALPAGRWKIGVGIDHGEHGANQVAVLMAWRPGDKVMYIIDEYVSDGPTTIAQDARGIRLMLQRHGWGPHNVDEWRGDNNSAGKARVGYKINQLLGDELGVTIDPPDKTAGSVETGEFLVNLALMQGRLKVVDGLVAVSGTMRYYDGTEEHKHISDAIRYLSRPILGDWDLSSIGRLYWH